ncbi:MAG: sensor domain-containing diguanylate cyclase [Sulfurovum sp.]|nr:sensor domain-containing diguanylate cyclase [Sulfurovum sp.]
MYKHPYRVSNATKSIQTNITSMHRYMKDVSIAKTKTDLKKAILLVDEDEKQVYSDYIIVFKYYLGSRHDIDTSYQLFIQWKNIREEVIALIKEAKYEEAQYITKHRGYEHILLLNTQVEFLVTYANNKAKLFLAHSIQSEKEAIRITLLLIFILIVLVIIIVIILIKYINSLNTKREETLQLLYQAQAIARIGRWSYDIKADILEWSDETYSIFERNKQDKVQHGNDFFAYIHEDDLQRVKDAYSKHLLEQEFHIITHRIVTTMGVKYIEQKCKTFVDHAGQALVSHGVIQDVTESMSEKIDLNKKLVYDELTQVYNRFFFNKNINSIIKQVNPLAHLGLVMIDIDFFKKVNDNYGHDVGDHVLKEFSQLIKSSMKKKDYFIRWGGEEFILLLEIPSMPILIKVLTKIQKQIIQHDFTEVHNITCSFGAVLYQDNEDIDDTIIRADKALYKAKTNGRNRIEVL